MPPTRVIGIDAGGTKLLGGVVDDDLTVHHRVHRLWRGADRQETIEIFVGAVEEIRRAAPDVGAVGFGLPALVDGDGVAVWSNHLPINDVPFAQLMSERLGLPVFVDNDANAAVLAEHRRGAAMEAHDAILIALGTGIGGGLILGGALHRGAHGFGGELGHLVVDIDGADCPGACPGRGCFETVVSGSAIGAAAIAAGEREPGSTFGKRLAGDREIPGSLVTELAHDGDEQAQSVLAEIGRALGAGLAGLVNTLDPEIIVVGGGAVRAGDLLLDPARDELAARVLPPHRGRAEVVPAAFGEESGMLGAALLAFEGQR